MYHFSLSSPSILFTTMATISNQGYIRCFEHIQRQVTKFILNNFYISYKTSLLELNLLPFMHIFNIQDIFLQSSLLSLPQEILTSLTTSHFLKHKPDLPFTTNSNITFTLATLIEFIFSLPSSSVECSFCLCYQPLNCHHQSQTKSLQYMWNHFVDNFDDDKPCTYHYLCPCSKCHKRPPPANFQTL